MDLLTYVVMGTVGAFWGAVVGLGVNTGCVVLPGAPGGVVSRIAQGPREVKRGVWRLSSGERLIEYVQRASPLSLRLTGK